jgi:bifunctional non-homologous end joining protein LigD
VKSVSKQFVVQEHRRGDEVHWDLMLEGQGTLATYRVPLPAEKITADPVIVEKIVDHDLKFLTYEGPVNKGLGTVRIVDSGEFEMIEKTEKTLRLHIEGKILCGEFAFERIEGDRWQFSKFRAF